MDLTWGYGIAIIGSILLFLAIVAVKKKPARMTMGWVGGILLLAGFILPLIVPQLGQGIDFSALAAGAGGVQIEQPQQPQEKQLCAVEDTTVTLSAEDKFTSTASGGTHRYRVNGAPALTVADAGTFTASPFDTLQILWGNETSNSYFGVVSTVTVPCAGTKTYSTQTYQNGTLTMNIYNEEGNLIVEGAENETIGSGEASNMKIEIRASDNKGFPYGGIIIVEMAGTNYSEADTSLSFGDLVVSKTDVPGVYTLSSTLNKAVAFDISAFEETALHTGTLTVLAESAVDPDPVGADITVTFRPKDYFINEDTGGSFDGPAVEDEDKVATFGHITTFTAHVD